MSMWQKKKSHYKEVTQRVLPCKQELKESTHLVPGKDQMNPFLFSSQALRAASHRTEVWEDGLILSHGYIAKASFS